MFTLTKKIVVSAVLVAAIFSGAAVVVANQFFSVASSNVTINKFGECRVARATNGLNYFVPTNTATEWTAFRNNKPSTVSLNSCGPNNIPTTGITPFCTGSSVPVGLFGLAGCYVSSAGAPSVLDCSAGSSCGYSLRVGDYTWTIPMSGTITPGQTVQATVNTILGDAGNGYTTNQNYCTVTWDSGSNNITAYGRVISRTGYNNTTGAVNSDTYYGIFSSGASSAVASSPAAAGAQCPTSGCPIGQNPDGSCFAFGGIGVGILGESDYRLKENITFFGFENGYRTYIFNYKKDPSKVKYIGVIAQEVLLKDKDAIVLRKDGYYLVNYTKIGVRFRKYTE